MVRIGIVGVGFMGMIHYLAALRTPGAKVTAIAARDPKKRAGDWTGIKGNFGPPGERMDLTGVAAYATPEELLADPNVDLVDVCLPSDQHARVAELALAAGKAVLVEKPIALTLAEADRMLAAAARAPRLLMVAHVLPFFPDFRVAVEAVRGGRHGKLLAASFRRHISPPNWSDAFADAARTGGPAVDLHIHDTHFVAMLCGRPAAVQSIGRVRDGLVEYIATNYVYPNGPAVSATSGACSHAGRPFTHGFELQFEHATIVYEAGGPMAMFGPEGRTEIPLVGSDPVDAFAAELAAAVAGVAAGKAPPELDARTARDALALCLAEVESARSGRPVALD